MNAKKVWKVWMLGIQSNQKYKLHDEPSTIN